MYRYILYGLIIESDLDFPQLIECKDSEAKADITIEKGEIPEVVYEGERIHKYCDFSENECWLCNQSIYMVVRDGNRITYELKPEHKYDRTYLLGWGMSMICLERKTPAIHCSTITDGKYAYLIAGESGSGKSTVSDTLIEKGYKFLADDIIRVELDDKGTPIAYPCFPFRKLCRDAALRSGYNLDELIYIDEDKDKFLVPSQQFFYYDPLPVKALIILGVNKNEEVETTTYTGIDSFHAVVNNLFLRHLLRDKKYAPFNAQPCLKTAAKIDCHRISRPQGKDTLAEIMSKVEEIINAAPSK